MDTETVTTPADLAREKGVTRSAVYLAIKSRQLRSETVLGRVVIDKSSAALWTPAKTHSERGKKGGRPKGITAPNTPTTPTETDKRADGSEGKR